MPMRGFVRTKDVKLSRRPASGALCGRSAIIRRMHSWTRPQHQRSPFAFTKRTATGCVGPKALFAHKEDGYWVCWAEGIVCWPKLEPFPERL